jgi:hypothetical protein
MLPGRCAVNAIFHGIQRVHAGSFERKANASFPRSVVISASRACTGRFIGQTTAGCASPSMFSAPAPCAPTSSAARPIMDLRGMTVSAGAGPSALRSSSIQRREAAVSWKSPRSRCPRRRASTLARRPAADADRGGAVCPRTRDAIGLSRPGHRRRFSDASTAGRSFAST